MTVRVASRCRPEMYSMRCCGFSTPVRSRRYFRSAERFFAWMQRERRLLVRWEFYAENFLGFIQLAAMSVLTKRI